VRTNEPPLGAEIILHIEDTLGKLIQPFPKDQEATAETFVECEAWKVGALPRQSGGDDVNGDPSNSTDPGSPDHDDQSRGPTDYRSF
jgi:hypothetical protein